MKNAPAIWWAQGRVAKGIGVSCTRQNCTSRLLMMCLWKSQRNWGRPFYTVAKRNSNNLRCADDTTLMAESEEQLKSFLMRVKASEKSGLKLNIQKATIMASHPITSWQIDGKKVETVTDFIFLGSIITADDDCSHKINRHLLLGIQAMTNVSSVIQSRMTLCELMDCSTPSFPFLHHLQEFSQTHVLWVGDAIQPSTPLLSPSSLARNLSQHHGLFHWVGSSHQVVKILEFQLHHQSFQCTLRTDLL